jgi:hypothetical protein
MSDYRKMTDDALLGLLRTEGDRLPRQIVDEIARRNGIAARLGAIVADPYNWNEPLPAWWVVVHAVYILGAIGSADTVQPLLRALRYAEACENDWVSEDLPSIFGAVGAPAMDGLRKIAADRTTGWYARSIALEGLAAITLKHPDLESGVFELLRGYLRNEEEERMVRQAAGHVLLDFLRQECRDDLLSFGREDRQGLHLEGAYKPGFTDDDVQREFARGTRSLERYTGDWLLFYEATEIAGRRERWEEDRREHADTPEHAPSYELCPFAEGKKRKKCCLGKAGLA